MDYTTRVRIARILVDEKIPVGSEITVLGWVRTVRDSKNPKGFFHALGHGVGLEIHEEPFMRQKSPRKLRKGMVVTVEPGLYYEGLGGCRIEDVVHLVPGGCELISRAPYKWEIA